MKILLVAMPWMSLGRPSLAIEVLAATLRRDFPEHEVATRYANLEWGAFVRSRTGGRIGPAAVGEVSEGGGLIGDWTFSGALRGCSEAGIDAFAEHLGASDAEMAVLREYYFLAPEFTALIADDIASGGWDLVGFTTTFDQTVASLAASLAIKARRPAVRVVLGGAACSGGQGAALQRAYPFVDFTVSGNGELPLSSLVADLAAGGSGTGIAGVSAMTGGSQSVTEAVQPPHDMAHIPSPDFDEYFAALRRLDLIGDVDPVLIVESSRGCWWGQKSHCTFCGLNGLGLAYRVRDPGVFTAEMAALLRRHPVLDVFPADTILSRSYAKAAFPALAALASGVRIQYEIKANAAPSAVAEMAAAHIRHLQPGIESLSSDILRQMHKGVRSTHNAALLREVENNGMTASWNWLIGFPDETADAYAGPLEQVRNLVHLQPPTAVMPFMIHRYSPYFDAREELFPDSGPQPRYAHVYGDQPEIAEIAAFFRHSPSGINGTPTGDAVVSAGAAWQAAYPTSSLVAIDAGDDLLVLDRRSGHEARDLRMAGLSAKAYRWPLGIQDATPRAIATALSEAGDQMSEAEAEAMVEGWYGDGLVFRDEGFVAALATRRSIDRVKIGNDWSGPVPEAPGELRLAIGSMDAWPDSAALDALRGNGIAQIAIEGDIDLDAMAGERAARLVCLLRDAQSSLVSVSLHPTGPAGSLAFLARDLGDDPAAFAYGTLHYRRGDIRTLVRDARSGTVRRHWLEGPDQDALLALSAPAEAGSLPDALRQPVMRLEQAGLVLRTGGWLVALPVHLRQQRIDVGEF
jgi:ribosomal peptide maturation radical SAM protein 1